MASMMIGSYVLASTEGFDEFMKALGVGIVMRKMGNSVTPTMEFTENGGEYTMKTVTTLKTTEVKFKLGVPFAETTMDGREAQTTFTFEDSKLTQVQKASKGSDATYVRTFTATDMTLVCETSGVKSTRVYKKN